MKKITIFIFALLLFSCKTEKPISDSINDAFRGELYKAFWNNEE